MKKRYLSDHEAEDILNSLDDLEKAAPLPFFYTRLRAKMSAQQADKVALLLSGWRPALVFPLFGLLLLLNIVTIVYRQKPAPRQIENSSRQGLVDAMAADYDLRIATY